MAASIEHCSSSLGLATTSITAPLTPGKDAIVKLDDTTGQSDRMRLADIHCVYVDAQAAPSNTPT